jgi:hypothetical protein
VHAPGASALDKYVQSATLGDDALDKPWFTHDDLFDAGRVSFTMGPLANEDWGSDPAAAPPSLSTHELSAFGCPPRKGPKTFATTLTYVGDTRAQGDAVALVADLTTVDGSAVPGKRVTFEIAGRTVSAVTGGDGRATVVVDVPDHGRSQLVVARFAGDGPYLPSETSATIQWGKGPKPR